MTTPLDAETRTSIEDRIREIDGVLHASFDAGGPEVWVVRDPNFEAGPLELAVRHLLTTSAHESGDVPVRITLPAADGPRRRVRFVNTERSEGIHSVTVTVSLEWNDTVHSGSATGERGATVELKTTAHAALAAIENLCGFAVGFRIVGVKQVHAFDSDIMVASLLRTEGPPLRLIGAVIVSDKPMDSAALAVLSALNRTLGNFLQTTD